MTTLFIVYVFFTLQNIFHYVYTSLLINNITEKQKSYIISAKASLTLSIISVIYNVLWAFDMSHFDDTVSNFVLLYFMSYLMMDLIIGYIFYRKHIGLLSGYIHHLVYIFICCLSIYYNISYILCLFLIDEIPSFILNLGSINSIYRNDNLFGSSFFFFRIVYHVFLMSYFLHSYLTFCISSLALCLHLFWFKNWVTKYFFTIKDHKY